MDGSLRFLLELQFAMVRVLGLEGSGSRMPLGTGKLVSLARSLHFEYYLKTFHFSMTSDTGGLEGWTGGFRFETMVCQVVYGSGGVSQWQS